MTALNKPTPGTGPDATLNLHDPTTWIMILSAVGAIVVKAFPAVAGWHIDQFYAGIALLCAAIVVAVGLVSKHHLAAALSTVATAVPATLEQIATPLATATGVDIGPLAERIANVEQAVTDLKTTVPVDQVKAALGQLLTGQPQPLSVSPTSNQGGIVVTGLTAPTGTGNAVAPPPEPAASGQVAP